MIEPIVVGGLKLPFSHAIRCDGFVFVLGQASVDLQTGEIIGGTFAEEMRRSMHNLRRVLESAGARWEDIVRVVCYLRREGDLEEYNQLYREFCPGPYPARTITNCLPRSLLFEVDCIARIAGEVPADSRAP